MDEILEIVDGDNNVTGKEKRSVVHNKLLKHRSVHLFAVNGKCQIVVGKRSMDKEELPGRWSFLVSGHKRPDESPEDSLRREVKEEIGIEADMKYMTTLPPEEESGNHFSYVFLSRLDIPITSINFDRGEFSEIKEFSKENLRKNAEDKGKFSSVFARAFKWLLENGKI